MRLVFYARTAFKENTVHEGTLWDMINMTIYIVNTNRNGGEDALRTKPCSFALADACLRAFSCPLHTLLATTR